MGEGGFPKYNCNRIKRAIDLVLLLVPVILFSISYPRSLKPPPFFKDTFSLNILEETKSLNFFPLNRKRLILDFLILGVKDRV